MKTPTPGPASPGGQQRRDALLYLQVRALNGGYRDDLAALASRLALLSGDAPHPERGLLDAARTQLARYTALQQAGSEPQQAFKRRRDQQWHAVLCELDEFLDRHAGPDPAS